MPTDLPTTSEDRSMAVVAWVIGIFTGFLGPLILYFVRRERSPFSAFHAMQALLFHIAILMVMIPVIGIAVVVGISSAVTLANQHSNAPPVGLFVGFGLIWLSLVVVGLVNLVVHVVMAINASSGKWTRLPLLGKWAMRMSAPGAM